MIRQRIADIARQDRTISITTWRIPARVLKCSARATPSCVRHLVFNGGGRNE
jgi:hypothetical protein